MAEVKVESEEEEFLVYAEFEDTVNIEKYRTVHVLGVDGKNPIMQMDDTFFTGIEYLNIFEIAISTNLKVMFMII